MKIIYAKSFENTVKKLKKYRKEYDVLNKLIKDLSNVNSFDDLKNNNYFKIHYNFERLKYQNNKFYSFNLNKNSGKIRLIAEKLDTNIILVYISFNHYKDFSEERVIYDD